MTPEQRQKLSRHVALHKSFSMPVDHEVYYLNNGEIIEFTDRECRSNNSKFELNNNPVRKIWFSQLSQFFFDKEDFRMCYATMKINGKDEAIYEFDDVSFWEIVQGKKFRVDSHASLYVVNWNSVIIITKNLENYSDLQNFVKKCIDGNNFDEIGDLLKTAQLYDLIEL